MYIPLSFWYTVNREKIYGEYPGKYAGSLKNNGAGIGGFRSGFFYSRFLLGDCTSKLWEGDIGKIVKKIDRLLRKAAAIHPEDQEQYDFEKLSTEELKELIRDDITEERMMEILKKARR